MHKIVLLSWLLFMTSIFYESCSGASGNDRSQQISVEESYCLQYQDMRLNITGNRRKFGVINGKTTKPGEYPHMAALGWYTIAENKKVFLCGASLISNFFLITAAHCTNTTTYRRVLASSKPIIVRLGSRNINSSKFEIPKDYYIKDINVHPKYQSKSNDYDIALIQTLEKIVFTKYIHPACLPYLPAYLLADLPAGTKFTVTGWGRSSVGRSSGFSEELLYGEVDLFDMKKCKYLFTPFKLRDWNRPTNNHLCAGKLDGTVDTCQGDSGGPLQYKINKPGGMHRLIGITIFGSTTCARVNLPSLYTNIFYFLPWIRRKVWPKEFNLRERSKRRDLPKWK